ncbi:threonine-phosphate decarboxylase CobD [Marinobacter sp. X15-166B]|uniref:threonine-phosphate decarboxylase CobD n=1 Tax=Marinobacter sp. X15-166B TaxID=1897620 RepID=UPI00085C78B0|nr:threonine-phosphate decarboxylase CobD [Marinobacter sp. X15-166B]OEY66236.1 threonine-phosphate decarboxylase [Marinobacter sp. X15-166B]
MRPEHGGRLNEAAQRWGIPRGHWLDLSTGINPVGWPVPDIPAELWHRLPEPDDGLAEVIRDWAAVPAAADCEPVAGSQAAIMALPRLRRPCRVGIPMPGYREHEYSWRSAGHRIVPIGSGQTNGAAGGGDDRWLDALDVLVWINPNNPTGDLIPPATLLRWHRRLQQRGGWLVVDEAFMDATPEFSLCAHAGRSGLIILRSLGKFYGLAGVRAGAVFAEPAVLTLLRKLLGPWTLNGPARYVMAHALTDRSWQEQARGRLQRDSRRLADLLQAAGLTLRGGSFLFQTVSLEMPGALADRLAAQGILLRVFHNPGMVRFGLAADEEQWQRLARALRGWNRE